jgi:hypothetical protein
MYLRLFHGRKDVKTSMDDWGTEGPVFGPLEFVHTTYVNDIKLGFPGGKDQGACPDLSVIGDCVYYGGVLYGDWSVFGTLGKSQDDKRAMLQRLEAFDPKKAKVPESVRVQE